MAYPTVILIAPDRSIVIQDLWPANYQDIISGLEAQGLSESECSTTSIKDRIKQESFDEDVVIYPNPCNNEAVVSFISDSQTECKIKVFDALGKLMYTYSEALFNVGEQNLKIDTEDFEAGIYFVNVEFDNKNVTKKISVVK